MLLNVVFDAMHARYGDRWTAMNARLQPDALAAHWTQGLRNVDPELVRRALAFLPVESPPTLPQFQALCRSLQQQRDPDEIRANCEAIRATLAPVERDSREWARSLHRRELAGEKLTPTVRAMYRAVLKLD